MANQGLLKTKAGEDPGFEIIKEVPGNSGGMPRMMGGLTPSTPSTMTFRPLRSAPLTWMTSRMSPPPMLPSRLLSMTPLPEVLPPSRPLHPSTSSPPLLLLWPPLLPLPSLPLPPSPTPVCTTPPTPTPSTTSATLVTLATLTTLESSATPTPDFPSLRLLPLLLRNKLCPQIFSPSNSSRAFVHQSSFDCQSEP